MRLSSIVLTLLVSTLTNALTAQYIEDRDNRAPTATGWLTNVPFSTVQSVVNSGNRIVDLELASNSPRRYTISYVPNVGTFRKRWWYYIDVTASQVTNLINTNQARLTDIEPYNTSSGLRFMVLMESNAAGNGKAWWWYFNTSISTLSAQARANGARIVDLEQYTIGSTTYYAAIMIRNTGQDAKSWWWYTNISPTSLALRLAANGARLWDIQRLSNGNFNVVMVRFTGEYSWYYYNQTSSQVTANLRQLGARLIDVEQVGTRYHVVMTSAVNASTNRTRDAMIGKSNGIRGFYLRRVPSAGSAYDLAGIHADTRFEPASTLKTLHLIRAMRDVNLGQLSLSTPVTINTRTTSTNSCPQSATPTLRTLRTTLQNMMRASSNSDTRAITDRFGGFAGINAQAGWLGLGNTRVNHHIGCGTPANYSTLRDFGRMHERVIKGYLGTHREDFYSIFASSFYGTNSYYAEGELTKVIDEEATRAGLTSTQKSSFISAMRVRGKKGGYGVAGLFYRAWAGYVRIPYFSNGGPDFREYVTGAFVDGGSNEPNAIAAAATGAAEVLRDEIRAAMGTLKNHVFGDTLKFGTSCGAGLPAFEHTATGTPEIGRSMVFVAQANRATSHQVSLEIGSSNTGWNRAPLPLHLDFMGAPGCYWRTNSLASVFLTAVNGRAALPVTLPVDKSLIGIRIYTQFLIKSRGNAAGLITTNGLRVTVGGQK